MPGLHMGDNASVNSIIGGSEASFSQRAQSVPRNRKNASSIFDKEEFDSASRLDNKRSSIPLPRGGIKEFSSATRSDRKQSVENSNHKNRSASPF